MKQKVDNKRNIINIDGYGSTSGGGKPPKPKWWDLRQIESDSNTRENRDKNGTRRAEVSPEIATTAIINVFMLKQRTKGKKGTSTPSSQQPKSGGSSPSNKSTPSKQEQYITATAMQEAKQMAKDAKGWKEPSIQSAKIERKQYERTLTPEQMVIGTIHKFMDSGLRFTSEDNMEKNKNYNRKELGENADLIIQKLRAAKDGMELKGNTPAIIAVSDNPQANKPTPTAVYIRNDFRRKKSTQSQIKRKCVVKKVIKKRGKR